MCSIFLFVVHHQSLCINFSSHFQTDTSLAIEAKFMQRWEFDSIDQAASRISSWFSGTFSEKRRLKEYLDSTIGMFLPSYLKKLGETLSL